VKGSKDNAMELLDRYLEAVRKQLPWQRQDDIIAELRANLESQLEEKEDALGRPLTAAEAEAWIRQLDSPLRVAAGYQPQQYLIGPAVFPIYRNVMRIALTWGAIVYCIGSAVALLAKTPQVSDVAAAFFRAPGVLINIAAWVTLVFAVIEYLIAHGQLKLGDWCKPAGGWSVAELPPAGASAPGGKKPKSFAAAVAEVIFGFFWLVWLLLIPAHPFLLLGPGVYYLNSLPYQLAPIWVPAYWCLVALNVLQVAWNAYHLAAGDWQRPQQPVHLVYKIIGLAPIVLLLTAPGHAPLVLKNPAADQVAFGASLDAINRGINMSLEVICVIVVLTLIWEIVKTYLEEFRRRVAA
jgi:hypothetical protein